jgi:hypothetical protein|tara:strand:+ start:5373 stop:5699 length:327 start_codon:yes stop_codon:yes gene_type:complete
LNKITCQKCGVDNTINRENINECKVCGEPISAIVENVIVNNIKHIKSEILNIEIGTIVKIDNKEHPWHDEIALICDKKHKFVKIELRGITTWVSNNWVKIDEHIKYDS